MKTNLLKPILMAVFVIFGFANISAQTTTFSTGLEGWSTGFGANDPVLGPVTHAPTEGLTGDGALQLDRNVLTTGQNNANFGLASTPGIDANTLKVMRLRYKNGTNGDQVRVQGSNDGGGTITQTIFTIGANSTEWVTSYFDMTGVTGWANNIDQLDMLIRRNYAAGEGVFLLDEIEFLASIPPPSMSGFVQNPSFEDLGGQIAPWSPANQPYATVAVSSDEANTGAFSLKHEYSAVPTGTHFVFNNYIHDFGALQTEDVAASLWVKVIRPSTPGVSPLITVQGQNRTGTTLVVGQLVTDAQNKTTTLTNGEWEEISYTYTPAAAYSTAQFRYGILLDNLQIGDIVYVDDLFANLGSLSISDNALESIRMYPNPSTGLVTVKTQEAANIDVYNIVGKLIKSEKMLSSEHTMDVSNLSTGIYIVKLTSEGKSQVIKLIIE